MDETQTGYQLEILFALNRLNKHVYAGTVPEEIIRKRRKNNKIARDSRRKNR